MRSCFFAITLLLLSHPAWSQESRPAAMQAQNLVWLEPCPGVDAADVEALNARIDCLERRSEAMEDSQHLLLQSMLRVLEEQFLNEPAKIVEHIPAVANAVLIIHGSVFTVINCVPPLIDKSGFVLISAKLSNWMAPEQDWRPMTDECMRRRISITFNPLASQSRSEGCYVNRTWFDWYTRQAASEGWPTDEATLCQESVATDDRSVTATDSAAPSP